MHELYSAFISSYDGAKVIEIDQDLTELRSNRYCHVI